jgi:hypothetical protein
MRSVRLAGLKNGVWSGPWGMKRRSRWLCRSAICIDFVSSLRSMSRGVILPQVTQGMVKQHLCEVRRHGRMMVL